MEVVERVFLSRLLLKIDENKEYSKSIGVTDESKIMKVIVDGRKEKECVADDKNSNGFGIL